MNIIWKTDQATDKNAAWVTTEGLHASAHQSRLQGRETLRHLPRGREKPSEMEMDMVEIQTIHRICTIATNRMNATRAALRKLAAELNAAIDVIQAREHALESNSAGYKGKKDPVNEARSAVSLPKSMTVDYAAWQA